MPKTDWITLENIVLNHHPYGESSVILSLFSKEKGAWRGTIRGGRSLKKGAGVGTQLWTRSHITLRWSEKRDLQLIRDISPIDHCLNLFSHPKTASVLWALAQILEKTLPPHQEEVETYRLTLRSRTALQRGGSPLAILDYTIWWLLFLHGVMAKPSRCVACHQPLHKAKAMSKEGFFCQECEDQGQSITPEEGDWFHQIRALPPESMKNMNLRPSLRMLSFALLRSWCGHSLPTLDAFSDLERE